MAGYLDEYGASEERRAQTMRRVIRGSILLVSVTAVSLILYFVFRNYQEKRQVKSFLELLRAGDYQHAYALWGCTEATPCREYTLPKFMEDWGPSSEHAGAAGAQIRNVDACGSAVVIAVNFPKSGNVSLWIDRSNGFIGYAPWAECPGRHWRLGRFFRSLFG